MTSQPRNENTAFAATATEADRGAPAPQAEPSVAARAPAIENPLLAPALCGLVGVVAVLGWLPALVSAHAPLLQWILLVLVLGLSLAAVAVLLAQRSARAARLLDEAGTRSSALQALRRASLRLAEGDLVHLPPEMDMDEDWRDLSLAMRAAIRQMHARARSVQHASAGVIDAAAAVAAAQARAPSRDAIGKWQEASRTAEAASAGWTRWQQANPPQPQDETAHAAHAYVDDIANAWRMARLRVEDMGSRSRRLVDGAGEMKGESEGLVDLAERMGVLAVQSALHAARLGEAGRGVAVVAENMNNLSNDIMASARRVAALVEVAGTDMEGVRRVSGALLEGVDDGTRVSELLREDTEASHALLVSLAQALAQAHTQARETSEALAPLASPSLRAALDAAQSANDAIAAATEEMKARTAKLDAQAQEWQT